MTFPIYVVDAFADRPLTGNPAAVCILREAREAKWAQSVAAEMNLAETAFLVPTSDRYILRWFTPTVEVDLCGHATLASAHVLWESGALRLDAPALFHTRSGLLTCRLQDGWIEMDFPAEVAHGISAPPGLEESLGARCRWVGQNRMDYLALLDTESAVRALRPDMAGLAAVGVRGVIVTAQAEPGQTYDFVSRFFAPGAGIPEDPVTGSAHCALAPFWSERLGERPLVGYQASARGGTVRAEVRADRVLLRGKAITIVRGDLLA